MQLNRGIYPSAEFTKTLAFPGITTENACSLIGMTLNTYAIQHNVPVDPTMDVGVLEHGVDDRMKQNNLVTFFEFKGLLDEYNREFTKIVVSMSIYNNLYLLNFKCW